MSISYKALRKTMEEHGISWYMLAQNGMDNHTLQRLRKDQNITTKTIDKLCNILNCTPNDILTFTKDEIDV